VQQAPEETKKNNGITFFSSIGFYSKGCYPF